MLLILIMLSINSSDKNKCYEMIRKLSDIYQSDKEYLKVCKGTCGQWSVVLCYFRIF